MISATAGRVERNTPDDANEQIRWQTEVNIARYSKSPPDVIDERLDELDREWDIERYITTIAPTFSLVGLGLGATIHRKWFLLPAVVQVFLLQHAVQGWCPPLPFFRRLGFRTQSEIDYERYALKSLRGDFRNLRRDINRAKSDGMTILEYQPLKERDESLEAQMRALSEEWKKAKGSGEFGFLVGQPSLEDPGDRKYFLAMLNGSVEAFCVCTPVYARNAIYFDLLRRKAPEHIGQQADLREPATRRCHRGARSHEVVQQHAFGGT